jgi:hypothetical protein
MRLSDGITQIQTYGLSVAMRKKAENYREQRANASDNIRRYCISPLRQGKGENRKKPSKTYI